MNKQSTKTNIRSTLMGVFSILITLSLNSTAFANNNLQAAQTIEAKWSNLVAEVIHFGVPVSETEKMIQHLIPNNHTVTHVAYGLKMSPVKAVTPSGQVGVTYNLIASMQKRVRKDKKSDVWAIDSWAFQLDLKGQLLDAEHSQIALVDEQAVGARVLPTSKEDAVKKWQEVREFWYKRNGSQKPRDYDTEKKYFRDEA